MNLLDGNLTIPYLILLLLVLTIGLRALNPTKRHRQWLYRSFILGLPLGPIVAIYAGLRQPWTEITFFNGPLMLIELMLFSGLMWAIAATWLISVKRVPSAALTLNIDWVKVSGYYLIMLGGLWLSNTAGHTMQLGIITTCGLLSIILAARQPRLIMYAALSAVVISALSLVVAYLVSNLDPQVSQHQLPFTSIPLAFSVSSLISLGVLAISAPIVSHWWFGQPLNAS